MGARGVLGVAGLLSFAAGATWAAVLAACYDTVLRHSRDVHPTWAKSSIETLSNTRVWGSSTRAKSEEDFDSY